MVAVDDISFVSMTNSLLFPLKWDCRKISEIGKQETQNRRLSISSVGISIEGEISTYPGVNISLSRWETGMVPRTDLGKKLLALRNKAIGGGMKLLTEDEVLEVVKRRRGEIVTDETNLY